MTDGAPLQPWRAALGDRVERDSHGTLTARCPAHDDDTPSLQVTIGTTGKVVATCHAGCTFDAIRTALNLPTPSRTSMTPRIVATYDYLDANGTLLYQKIRKEPKDFRVRRPDGSGWTYSLGDAPRVLYRTPQLQAAIAAGTRVAIVEGEKDADALHALSIVATCNLDGAAKDGQRPKWKARETAQLQGVVDVVIIPDNDDAGRAHARAVVTSLATLTPAPVVRVLELPGLDVKGDVSDWLANGGTAEQLTALMDAAPLAAEWLASQDNAVPATTDSEPLEDAGTDLSEDALARAFTAKHRDGWRHVRVFNQWLRWDGARWAEDTTLTVFDDARDVARYQAALAQLNVGGPLNRKVRNAATTAAIVKLASADRAHAITAGQLDRDTMLLNTPTGAVDLRTGILRPNAPADLCTKITGAAPGGTAPRWRQFLSEITAMDTEIMDYLQRVAGYAATGSVQEHALIFLIGSGGNGKSLFLEILGEALGDYATVAAMSTFTESNTDQHPTELARLRGARLVTATETEDGRRWAEAKVKQLTGGDKITARYMRQDFFEYSPQFTLIVAGNHRPRFRGVDESIRRRLHLVPFNVTFAGDDRDPMLKDTLRAELGGILQWAVEGALQWQQQGLNAPASVQAATSDYLEDEDTIGAWLAECVATDASAWASSADIFASWSTWANARGEYVGSTKRLGEDLSKRGIRPVRTMHARGFGGIRLLPMTHVTDPSHIDVYANARAHTAHTGAHAHTRRNTGHASHASLRPSDYPAGTPLLVQIGEHKPFTTLAGDPDLPADAVVVRMLDGEAA